MRVRAEAGEKEELPDEEMISMIEIKRGNVIPSGDNKKPPPPPSPLTVLCLVRGLANKRFSFSSVFAPKQETSSGW